MENPTCSVTGCSKQVRGKTGWCYGHYMKNWRYGTPTPEHATRIVDIAGSRFGTLTVVARIENKWRCECDCGRTRIVSAGELNRTGSANTCGYRPAHRCDNPTYSAAHDRIRTDCGPASLHQCQDCGNRAAHWSYDHEDPDEMHEMIGSTLVAYSANQSHYAPRCVPCHKRYDLGRLDALRGNRRDAA